MPGIVGPDARRDSGATRNCEDHGAAALPESGAAGWETTAEVRLRGAGCRQACRRHISGLFWGSCKFAAEERELEVKERPLLTDIGNVRSVLP